jgi:hypothetical protein
MSKFMMVVILVLLALTSTLWYMIITAPAQTHDPIIHDDTLLIQTPDGLRTVHTGPNDTRVIINFTANCTGVG